MYVIYTIGLDKILPEKVKILQYADDVCLYVGGKSIHACQSLLDRALSRVTRFLGVYFDTKLSWKHHINELINKNQKSINVLRMISSLRWGADPEVSLLFYRSTIKSAIDYGSLAYGGAYESQLRKLDVLHNKCLRLCIGLLRDTPINALLSEAGEYPLSIRRKKLGISFLISCHRKSSLLLEKLHKLFIQDLTSKYWITRKSPPLVTCYYAIQDHLNEISDSYKDNTNALRYNEIVTPFHCGFFRYDSPTTSHLINADFRVFLDINYKDYYIFVHG